MPVELTGLVVHTAITGKMMQPWISAILTYVYEVRVK
jgi:hypothetical protein